MQQDQVSVGSIAITGPQYLMRHLFWGIWAPFWVKYLSIVHGVCIGKLYKGITFTPHNI